METIDAKELAKANPKADVARAERALAVLRELQKSGAIKKHRYDLAMPFGGRRVQGPNEHPKTVTLRHRR